MFFHNPINPHVLSIQMKRHWKGYWNTVPNQSGLQARGWKALALYSTDQSRCTNVTRERKNDLLCAFIVQREKRLILCRDQRSQGKHPEGSGTSNVSEGVSHCRIGEEGGGSKFLDWVIVNVLMWLEHRGTRVEVGWGANLSSTLACFGILFCRSDHSRDFLIGMVSVLEANAGAL